MNSSNSTTKPLDNVSDVKPAVLYRYPGRSWKYLCNTVTDLDQKDVFVVKAFPLSSSSNLYFDLTKSSTHEDLRAIDLPSTFEHSGDESVYQDEKEDFILQVNNIKKAIEQDEVQKVIAFRKLIVDAKSTDLKLLLEELSKAYPKAFIYSLFTENEGVWIGVSPETLLRSTDKVYIDSLAGTKTEDKLWSEKELIEQSLVTNFIQNLAVKHGKNISATGPFTISTGLMNHLKTNISFECTTSLKSFLSDLQPTPAISGFPKKEALDYIKKNELSDRKYYCGYLGELSVSGNSHLYVNIRCMNILGSKAIIYTGCGITADSVAEMEYEETGLKAKTLLNFIK